RGFEWIDCNDMARGMITYIRKDQYSDDEVIVVCNFKPNVYQTYWLGVKEAGTYELLLNSDDSKYGGSGHLQSTQFETRQWNSEPWPYALEINVPAISVMVFKRSK
ncbi:MAG: 1,4-alpha-glucan branching enzyme, partial [Acaryochloridaceae cyanobacterium RL_2_7]|nr:1,4-alpha-glucan branching enzyme [Acaryochloridaceae cyanobacterium RL_2_7]